MKKRFEKLWALWHRYVVKEPFYKTLELKSPELKETLIRHARSTGVREEDVPAWICGFLCGAQGTIRMLKAEGDLGSRIQEIVESTEKEAQGEVEKGEAR